VRRPRVSTPLNTSAAPTRGKLVSLRLCPDRLGHCNHSRTLVVVEDRLSPSSPCGDSQIRTPELDELRSLFLLACHIGGKTLRYRGAEDHNTDSLLPSLFSSSLLRSRLGLHLLLACHIGGKIWWYQGAEDHNTNNLLPSLFSSLQQSHVPMNV
jgi:hypothetical protein